MNQLFRFIVNFCIVITLACIFLSSPAHSLSNSDFFQSGIEKMRLGNYQEAIPDFTAAIELRNDFAPAYSDRCLAYLQIGDNQNAIADCNQAINYAPHNVEAYINRGLAHYRQEDYLAAIADNNQVIQLQPHDFRAYYNRCIARAMLGNHQQAILDYNLALINIPQTASLRLADIYNDRGLAYFELSNLTAAIQDFSKAIHLHPHDYRAYYNRGCVCGRSGDNACAVEDFSKSIQLNPSNPQAYLNRGIAHSHLGHEPAAITDLQEALEYFAQNGETATYQRTLDLLKNLQQQLSSLSEIALIPEEAGFTRDLVD